MAVKQFPADFLWGASTSAFQVEGGFDEGGKGVATTDLGTRQPGVADNKIAADHYHHWKEDVDLMAELGLKVYRIKSIDEKHWAEIAVDVTALSEKFGQNVKNMASGLGILSLIPMRPLFPMKSSKRLKRKSVVGAILWKRNIQCSCFLKSQKQF